MPQYRVSFFQQSAQLEWAALKMRSAVYHGSEAKNAQAASEKAKRAFQRLENVADWKYHAQFFEIDMTDQR